jgi:aspartyl-tRNA(Asn)/glutamyl-tRNA(Gln) amidotransferase subunit A
MHGPSLLRHDRDVSDFPLTIQDAAAALRARRVTSVELTQRALDRADRHDRWLGSFLARFDDTALRRAKAADEELAHEDYLGPLHGIPVGVKDIFAAEEGPTTAQSLVLDPAWGEGHDAPIVRRLRQAGAVIVGKTSTMEFAVGMPDETKPFPVPRNPWDRQRWAGGSSSGSGNGVAAGFFLAGIGSDTGGSIRLPAAFCGVTGLMPTFSLVPKSGCVPLGYSLDHVGPLARSAWDCAAMLQALAGFDPSDPDSVQRPIPNYLASIGGGMAGIRIGVVREHHLESCDAEVATVFEAAVDELATLGAEVREVSIPLYREVTAASLVTMAAEACAYHHPDLESRWDEFFQKTRTLVSWGVLVSGADYVQAQRVRRVGQRQLARVLADVDVIVTPTAGITAPLLDSPSDVASMFGKIHTLYWDAVGNPVLAVPIGFAGGLPVSMQLAGAPFSETTILRAAHRYQQATDWHLQVPNLEATHG